MLRNLGKNRRKFTLTQQKISADNSAIKEINESMDTLTLDSPCKESQECSNYSYTYQKSTKICESGDIVVSIDDNQWYRVVSRNSANPKNPSLNLMNLNTQNKISKVVSKLKFMLKKEEFDFIRNLPISSATSEEGDIYNTDSSITDSIISSFKAENLISEELKADLDKLQDYPKPCINSLFKLIRKIHTSKIQEPDSIHGITVGEEEEEEEDLRQEILLTWYQHKITLIIWASEMQLMLPLQADKKYWEQPLLVYEHNDQNIDEIIDTIANHME